MDMTLPPPKRPKTDAERQATRRLRRREGYAAMRAALVRIAEQSSEPEIRAIAIAALIKEQE